jgi:hypothetical protein
MNLQPDVKNAQERISMSDGSSVLLFDRLGKEQLFGREECARNIYRLNASGEIAWQITTSFDSDGGPFTNVFLDGDELKAYRWDGGTYLINQAAGTAAPCALQR